MKNIFLLIVLLLLAPVAFAADVILGDSIARADCCSTIGPSDYLPEFQNLAVDGNTIVPVTRLIRHLSPGRAWVHVGINDVMLSNPHAERDMAQMLSVMGHRKDVCFVVDELGPMDPISFSPAREAVRLRLNAQLEAAAVPNVFVTPFVVTSFYQGEPPHPDNTGYAQQMPLVIVALSEACAR